VGTPAGSSVICTHRAHGYKLRVDPLSLSPSCVTRKKTARKKWPREILGARSARKEGLPPKPKSLNYALLSQRKNHSRPQRQRSF